MIKATITILDINGTELAYLVCDAKQIGDVLSTVEILIGHISDLPNDYDIHVEVTHD